MRLFFFFLLSLHVSSILSDATDDKKVLIRLTTDWKLSPLILEASEFVYEYARDNYWKFVHESIKDDSVTPPLICHKDEYEKILKSIKKYVPNYMLGFFEYTIANHDLAPRIELFNRFVNSFSEFQSCNEKFIVGPSKICGSENLLNALKNFNSSDTMRLGWSSFLQNYIDSKRHYKSSNNTSNTNESVLIYHFGQLGSEHFKKSFDEVMKLMKKESRFNYVYVPYAKKKCQIKVPLSKFGVELNIKKSEYNVQNDEILDITDYNANMDFHRSSDNNSESKKRIIQGFNITRITERFPNYGKKLKEFEDYLVEDSMEVSELKPWETKDVPIAFLEEVQNVTSFKSFTNLVQNFPLIIKKLSKRSVNYQLKLELQRFIKKSENVLPGVYLNNMKLSDDLLEFENTDKILTELKMSEKLGSFLKKFELDEKMTNLIVDNIKSYKGGALYHNDRLTLDDDLVTWVNDLERDFKYRFLPSRVEALFQMSMFGNLPTVALNAYNFVAFLDPLDEKFSSYVSTVLKLLDSDLTIRFGFVLKNGGNKRNLINFAFQNLARKKYKKALDFLFLVMKNSENITEEDIEEYFGRFTSQSLVDLVENSETIYDRLSEIKEAISQIGIKNYPKFYFNGKSLPIKNVEANFMNTVMMSISSELQTFYQHYSSTQIDDIKGLIKFGNNFITRMNDDLIKAEYVPLNVFENGNIDIIEEIKKNSYMFHPKTVNKDLSSLLIVLIDLFSESGRDLLRNIAGVYTEYSNIKFLIIFKSNCLNHKIQMKLKKLFQNPKCNKTMIEDFIQSEIDDDSCDNFNNDYIFESFGLKNQESAIIAGGKVCLSHKDKELSLDDIHQLAKLSRFNSNKYNYEDILPYLVTIFYGQKSISEKLDFPEDLLKRGPNVCEYLHPSNNYLLPTVTVLLDPFVSSSQETLGKLNTLADVFPINIKLVLLINENYESLPLRRIYKYVGTSKPFFDLKTGKLMNTYALFENLPKTPLYTLNMITPSSWMIQNTFSNCDLDNIYLKITNSGCYGEYSLKHILIEGHSTYAQEKTPSSGVQYTLSNLSGHIVSDTLVMNNLGYFQLKADIGLYKIDFKENEINKHTFESVKIENKLIDMITIDSFSGATVRISINKVVSEEFESSDDDSWSIFGNVFGSSKPKKNYDFTNDTINVFSVATGSLYERFLRIMMLSVLKHTKKPVKFWLLKNYLSSNFINSLDKLAKKYNFKYQLVQYQWPYWLIGQTEKQRIIWGYKILFLDVLFPLDLKRIIFVDADQVVREDLDKLNKMNLGSAPYAYVPFCNDRPEMHSYQFWRSGYWKNYLGGKPYHISALYVVDLEKFRNIAAGDRLRAHYQQLSHDPNSLANLDQDLPNNMIHEIPIKSLPQEWLWCETWCSDKTKKYAKTIDLCNNPKTKEPKLARAMRIIPEWKAYDQEIKDVLSNSSLVKDEL